MTWRRCCELKMKANGQPWSDLAQIARDRNWWLEDYNYSRPIIEVHVMMKMLMMINILNYLYYYKTLGLCLSVPNRLKNHLMKLDILWHTVSLGF